MMKYEIFKDVVENAVLDYLPPEYQNSELHLKRVKKVNGMDYDGLVVRKEDTNVCPVINMTQEEVNMQAIQEEQKKAEEAEKKTVNAVITFTVAESSEFHGIGTTLTIFQLLRKQWKNLIRLTRQDFTESQQSELITMLVERTVLKMSR